MFIALFTALGAAAGALCVYVLTEFRRRSMEQLKEKLDANAITLRQSWAKFKEKQQQILATINERESRLRKGENQLSARETHFNSRALSYETIENENTILKRDLQNLVIQIRKLEIERQSSELWREQHSERLRELGNRYLKDSFQWIKSKLNSSNLTPSQQKIQKLIEYCRTMGIIIGKSDEDTYLTDLQKEHRIVLRAELEREEQARIRREMREEVLRDQEIERAKERAERDEAMVKIALEKALAEVEGRHSAEVDRLKAKLAEIEERKRAISQAQLTKVGHVYVISNIGSFGKDVFKVGLTRRLDPMDRVWELGDASVPFPFDVHMMIKSNDAPALENALHQALWKHRINKVNLRKEFFRIDFETIRQIVFQHQGEVAYTADAEALQYYESLRTTDDELAEREKIMESVEQKELDDGVVGED